MKVIFACAGTGGHINPAIAIAGIILKQNPDAQILFIGTKTGLENELVKKSGFDIKHIRTGKLIRSFTFKNIKAITQTYKGLLDAKVIMKEFKPDLVIGTGGYICGPVMLAARKYKIPYILHESNAFPGISVKLLAKKAAKVMVGFTDAKARLKRKDNVVYTGTPAKFNREIINSLDKEKCKEELGFKNVNKKIVLVTGGSQGAVKFNKIVFDMVVNNLSEDFFVILVAGNKNYDDIISKKESIEKEKNIDLSKYIKIEKFVFDMPKMYKIADICITRSGAMTITELTLASKPSILIPLPSAAENHQLYNAKVLADAHAGIIIEQKNLTDKLLFEKVGYMLDDKIIKMMSDNASKLVINGVDNKIYKCIADTLKK